MESLGFPNFIIAQKVRAKITTTEETEGNKQILGHGQKGQNKQNIVNTKAGVQQNNNERT